MSVIIGGYRPGFRFRFNVTEIEPRILSFASTGISTGQLLDSNRVITTYSSVLTGSQYNVQIVPEQFDVFGQDPVVSIVSSNTGIASLDVIGNTTFNSTGTFSVIGTYTGDSSYIGLTVE